MADQTSHASQEGATRIIIASTALNAVLAIVQAAAGFSAHSSGLMADALHAITDIGVDLMLLAACWLARPAQSARPRRYAGLVQHAAPAVVGVILVMAGIEIARYAQDRPPLAGPATILASGIALFSVVSRGLLYRALSLRARRLRSPVLSAAAWHVGTDALSSLVATAGIATASLGYAGLDAIAAALIGLVIAYGGVRLLAQPAAALLRRLSKAIAIGVAAKKSG
ncbi:cation diffusion facilitator family transporter [Paraburkholderia sp. 2C]